MRGHEHEHETSLRPKGDRLPQEETDLMGRAAVAGRPDVLGPSGVLGLQRAVGNASVGDVVSSGGSPLDADVREDMEGRFGQDFSDVRVHTGSDAHESAKSVNAHAYTVGSNIVFQRDKYDPSSDSGKHMLAHELTHVVQQRSGPVEGTDTGGGVKVSSPSDRFEREAVANADRLMSAPSVQREEAPEEEETAQTYVQRAEEEEEAAAE
ncbi:eCIS core domain-containing protein [Lentzea sp. E54]|uniref:eCIS core domain-containing protein n=1 Tax=Lentzea xerophila TaxID=3435883 RepID=UPI003DA28E54